MPVVRVLARISRLLPVLLTQPGGGIVLADHGEPERVVVVGRQLDNNTLYPRTELPPAPDLANLMARFPGGGVAANGRLSGQMQHRGLFGSRMAVRVDGMYINSSGPNWMDPPLHYMPNTLIESFQVLRGGASVGSGDSLGGNVIVRSKRARFTDGDTLEHQADLSALTQTVDKGHSIGAMVGLANRRHRVDFTFSRDDGDDRKAGSGTVESSRYDRDTHGFSYGFRFDGHEMGLDYRRINTGETGTPSLPFDIRYYHTDLARLFYKGLWRGVEWDASLYFNDIEHRMNNYRLRPAPDFDNIPGADSNKLPPFRGDDRRWVDVESDGAGLSLGASFNWLSGAFRLGLEGHLADHQATVHDPDVAAFFVTNFDDSEIDKWALFVEWRGEVASRWRVASGLRYNLIHASTDPVDALPARLADRGTANAVTDGARHLRDRFNGADRTRTDRNLDAFLEIGYSLHDRLELIFGVAQKTRSPGYVERYTWLPLEVNAGLGDGNNYVGDPELDPEISREIEAGFDWSHAAFSFEPRLFYRDITDYIQGAAVSGACNYAADNTINDTGEALVCVSNLANGDSSPKQFANVDAKIYGFDARFGYHLDSLWTLDGVIGFVRGRRRDINDNLYRIAPPRLTLGLERKNESSNLRFETVLVERQDKLARSLLDAENLGGRLDTGDVPGYVLFNLRYSHAWPRYGLKLSGGVENLFDKEYEDALAGFNRVLESDVRVGERIPGPGRNAYLSLGYRW